MIVRGTRRDYYDRHPGPQDIAVVIEVADTTLQRNRTLKKQIYARGRIPLYWIINVAERQIECYTQPSCPIISNGAIMAQQSRFQCCSTTA